MHTTFLEVRGAFGLFVEGSMQAGVLVLLVVGVQRLLRRQLTPGWRHACWWIVLGRLLIPVAPPSSWSLFNLLPGTSGLRPAQIGHSGASPEKNHLPATFPSTQSSSPPPAASAPPKPIEPPPFPRGGWTSRAAMPAGGLAGLWALVAGLLLVRLGIQHVLFSRRIRAAMGPADSRLVALLDECRARMGVRRRIELLQGDGVSTPAVQGTLRPRLLLPQHLARTGTPDQLRHVFLHELAHVRRGDLLVHALTRVLQAAHWFNPLLAWGFRRLRADRELAADALVLGVAGEHQSRAYGLTIVQLLQDWSTCPTHPVTLGILEDSTSLERRIRAIAAYRPPSRWASMAAILLAALAAVSWTRAQTNPPRSEPAPATLLPASFDLLLQEATRRMESGDLAGALGSVERALESEPGNARAGGLLEQIQEGYRLAELGRREELGESGLRATATSLPSKLVTRESPAGSPSATSTGRHRILSLLESIRIPEIHFERIPLGDAVRALKALAQAHDPQGRGINFFINPYLDRGPDTDSSPGTGPGTVPLTGPVPGLGVPLENVPVRIDPALRDVRLIDVLRALTLSAEAPILFAVEDYAVVFAHKPPRHRTLVTRVFRTNPARLEHGLESTIRLLDTNTPARTEIPAAPPAMQDRVRNFFNDLGVSLDPPNAVFFNDRLGLLMVRAPLDEIEVVESALGALDPGIEPHRGDEPLRPPPVHDPGVPGPPGEPLKIGPQK